mmetsp:Transcript_92505/g.206763  ORF Transcript_92505/g.206763 Transcript_92505/m.206763 type:complete len:255 (-) Transcript_92505:1166-1930(-)
MAMLESQDDTSNVVLGMLLAAVETLPVVGGVELTTECRLHEEVERLRAVVRLEQLNDENRVGHHQNVLLVHHALLHAGLDDKALAQRLHGVGVAGNLVFPEVHHTEAAASEEANSLEIPPQDLLAGLVLSRIGSRLFRGSIHYARAPPAIAVGLDDVLQRSQKHGEGLAVQGQRLCGLGGHHHGRRSRFVGQESPLSKELGRARGCAGSELRLLDTTLLHDDFARIEDVERVAFLALLQDHLILGEVHLNQCLG